MPFELHDQGPLTPADQAELLTQHEAEVAQLLPLLGPLFGLAVLLFSLWDFWIDAAHAPLALALRLGLATAGMLAYVPAGSSWSARWRWTYLYAIHTSAIIVAQYLLRDGFVYGLGGIVACVFVTAVLTLQLRVMLQMLGVPTLLFVLLTSQRLAATAWINALMLYTFAVVLALILMLVVRTFRERAFLFEKQLLHLARHDSLTGAYNRGYLSELADHEVAVARRHGRPLALAMLDIDLFKSINDTHGHQMGDQVIRQLVATCKDKLRLVDHFGRIGGEEFVCILPEADAADAMLCAERLRAAVDALRLDSAAGPLRFTISVGVATLGARHASWLDLLRDADQAMYRAKRGGRNRVVLAD